MKTVSVGDEIESEIGSGTIRAITEDFIIIYNSNMNEELSIHMETHHWWPKAEAEKNTIDKERQVEVDEENNTINVKESN